MRSLFSVRGVRACASVVVTLLTTSACGGRSELGLGSEDPYGFDASVVGTHDSGSSDGGEGDVVDGGLLPADASAGDAVAAVPELADCLASPFEIHVVATDYNGATGAFGTSGSKAEWFARVQQDAFVDLFPGPGWAFVMSSDLVKGHGLLPGTYPSVPQSGASFVQIAFDGVNCPLTIPTGTFTVVDFAGRGDPAFFPRMLVWFDLRCGEGRLTGCVRYGE